jgi:predicted nucleic acid-binding protein
MAFDPSNFHRLLITDTCAVWHILSARRLYAAAFSTKPKTTFCITPTVLFECVYKPRKDLDTEAEELLARFLSVRDHGEFQVQGCDLDDLIYVSSLAPRLGSGELSCIATAYRIPTLTFMTDEKKARRFAEDQLHLQVSTTPRLYGWLHFHRYLSDSDHQTILAEHKRLERRPLTKFFEDAYETALQYRLMAQE